MSSDLHETRLLWHGFRGCAKHDGVLVDLRQWYPAALPGVVVHEVKFTPGIREAEVRCDTGWRDMTREEKTSAMDWLRRMAAATHAALDEKEQK